MCFGFSPQKFPPISGKSKTSCHAHSKKVRSKMNPAVAKGGGGLFHGSGRPTARFDDGRSPGATPCKSVAWTLKSSPLDGNNANGIIIATLRRRGVAYRVRAKASSNADANETSVSIDAPGWRGYGTGGRIWSSSKVLREYLKENGDVFVLDKNVVELGCGTGVVGIYAAKRGQARSVLLTDGGSDALLKLAEENASKNGVENISVHKLEWGVGKVSPTLRDCMKTNPPDLIVGSDCTYERKSHAALCDTIIELLGLARIEPSTSIPPRVLLAHQHRTFASLLGGYGFSSDAFGVDPNYVSFLRTCRDKGFRVEEVKKEKLAWHGLRNVSIVELT